MSTKLSCGIVGLPNVGKSTLFNALTRKAAEAANYPFCTIEPNVGVVAVDDPRLQVLSDISKTAKIIPASVTFVDIAGLVRGASNGEGLGNQFLAHIREVDAIAQVVRCFEDDDIIHVAGKLDPLDDMEVIHLELALSDLQMAESIFGKLEKQSKGKKESPVALAALGTAKNLLAQGTPLRKHSWTEEELIILNGYGFLTLKPLLYVCNVSEDDLEAKSPLVAAVRKRAAEEGAKVVTVCAKLEQELAELPKEDRAEFLSGLGLTESGLTLLIRQTFDLLGLMTFLTTGEQETRAWTITKGTTAQKAAGKIHTDIERGFIRAEVISYPEFVKYQGRVGAREAGRARMEGKEYLVQDGDVILFFHST